MTHPGMSQTLLETLRESKRQMESKYMPKDLADLMDGWYWVESPGHERSLVQLYTNPTTGLRTLAFNAADGGGLMPLIDLTDESKLTRVEIHQADAKESIQAELYRTTHCVPGVDAPGGWWPSPCSGDAVVCGEPDPRRDHSENVQEMYHYGGFIVAESIQSDANRRLIAMAPEMRRLLGQALSGHALAEEIDHVLAYLNGGRAMDPALATGKVGLLPGGPGGVPPKPDGWFPVPDQELLERYRKEVRDQLDTISGLRAQSKADQEQIQRLCKIVEAQGAEIKNLKGSDSPDLRRWGPDMGIANCPDCKCQFKIGEVVVFVNQSGGQWVHYHCQAKTEEMAKKLGQQAQEIANPRKTNEGILKDLGETQDARAKAENTVRKLNAVVEGLREQATAANQANGISCAVCGGRIAFNETAFAARDVGTWRHVTCPNTAHMPPPGVDHSEADH
jgi:hypothetical protein